MSYLIEGLMAMGAWILVIYFMNRRKANQDVVFMMSLPVIILIIGLLGSIGLYISTSILIALGLDSLNSMIQQVNLPRGDTALGKFNIKMISAFRKINIKFSGFQKWVFNLGRE